MKIEELNEIANDILVCRESEKHLQAQIDKIVLGNKEIQKMQAEIDKLKSEKATMQANMLNKMSENRLKSWKTETGIFSRAERVTARPVAGYDKQVKLALEAGEKLEGWQLVKIEYMSIRSNIKK